MSTPPSSHSMAHENYQTVSRPMSTPPSSHSMALENYCGLASLPARRKRGRPRRDEVLVSEPPLISIRQCTNLPGTSSQDLVGRTVSGIVDGTFEGGYILTVREGTSGQLFKGLVFDPRRSSPITPENDIAPHLPMVKWPSVLKPDQPRHEPAVASTKAQPVHQNVRNVHEPALFHSPAQAMQQDVQAFQRIQKNDPASVHAPLHVGAVQPFKREESTRVSIQAVMHQNVVTNLSPQRNEPAAFRVPSIPVQQNVKTLQPVQWNAPSAVHTPLKQLVEQNVMAVQPPASDDSAANITRPEVVASTGDPGFVKQISEPRTVVEECKPQLQDVCMNQLENRTPAAMQASASLGDLELLQVPVTTAPEPGNPMPPADGSTEATAEREFNQP